MACLCYLGFSAVAPDSSDPTRRAIGPNARVLDIVEHGVRNSDIGGPEYHRTAPAGKQKDGRMVFPEEGHVKSATRAATTNPARYRQHTAARSTDRHAPPRSLIVPPPCAPRHPIAGRPAPKKSHREPHPRHKRTISPKRHDHPACQRSALTRSNPPAEAVARRSRSRRRHVRVRRGSRAATKPIASAMFPGRRTQPPVPRAIVRQRIGERPSPHVP